MEAYQYLAQHYNNLMSDVDYDAWACYIDRLLGRTELRLFEAGCGTGSLTGRLYDMGYSIIASDISGEMLDIAINDARRHGRDIVFIQQDMRELSAGHSFDAVLCACDGPNYLDKHGLLAFFRSAFKMLRPGGRLLFDISSSDKLRSMDNEVYYDDSDEMTCIWHNRFDEALRTLTMDVTLFTLQHGHLYEKLVESHVQHAHEVGDVDSALTEAGFLYTDMFEAFATELPSEESARIQFVSHKE